MLPFWRHRQRLLSWALLALVETAVILPWLLLLYASQPQATWAEALPGTWLPLLIYLTAGIWESGSRNEQPWGRVIAMLGGSFLAYLLAYYTLPSGLRTGPFQGNQALPFIPIAGYLWFRGARSAIEGITYFRLFSQVFPLLGGQLIGILALMLIGRAADPKVELLLYWSVLLLFAAGLSLLLVTRGEALKAEVSEQGEPTGNSPTPALTALVVALVGLTLVASAFLSMERLGAILGGLGRLVGPVTGWLGQVALLIIVRWAMLIAPIFQWLMSRAGLQQEEAPTQETGEGEPPLQTPATGGSSFDIMPYLQVILIGLFFLLLLTWLYRLNRSKRIAALGEEERINLGFWRSLGEDLKGLLALLKRRAASAVEQATANLEGVDPQGARALFRRLQVWGAAKGRPRRPAETPNQYQRALVEQQPAAADSAPEVTAVYNQERYGRNAPSAEAIQSAREALDRLNEGFTR